MNEKEVRVEVEMGWGGPEIQLGKDPRQSDQGWICWLEKNYSRLTPQP